jgi:glycosyltransferase involved in cell wall biosynthesis
MSDRIRVLFVVGNFVAGGAERHLLELWKRLDRARFEVAIACFRREGAFLGEVESLGLPLHELRVGRKIYHPASLAGLLRLLGVMRRFRPHVVHGYLFGPNLFAALAGRLARVPVVAVAKRNVDAFESPRQVRVQRLTLGLATHVTAVSEAVADSAVALGVSRSRITVIPNGVDVGRFAAPAPVEEARRLLGAGADRLLGSVGCLAPRKDQGTLLEALALLDRDGRAFRAALVGEGPERSALEARAAALGLAERVRFMGERTDVERLLPGMDVFVLSSREEGIPNALLEAMAAARPCVATAVGGTPEVLRDGETGWLVPAGSPPALARALEEALARPDEARRRGEAAQRAVRADMSIEAMVRRHEDFYERAAGSRTGQGRGAPSVAYVTTTFPTFASFLEDEVHRLLARGVRVRVFALRGVGERFQPRHAPLVGLTTTVGTLPDPHAWGALLVWLVRRPGLLLGETARILWASRHSAYALAGHLLWLPAACRVARLVESEDLARVHGAWAHFPGTVAYLAARLTGRPFSLAAHAGADLYRTQAFLAEKVRAADFVATCVRGNASMLRTLAGPQARVHWIVHGVDLTRFDGAGRAPEPRATLLTVGRLSPAKGFDDAVRALGLLHQAGLRPALWIVGDGPERGALEALARAQRVSEAVQFFGVLSHEELLPLYRRAWLLVAPSRVLANGRRDGIPNVIVEAMAMGVPCVGTRAGGLEEAIVDGGTGALAAPGDPAGLARAIESLLRDPPAIERLGREARRCVESGFDAERSFERLFALFAGRTCEEAGAPVAGGGR